MKMTYEEFIEQLASISNPLTDEWWPVAATLVHIAVNVNEDEHLLKGKISKVLAFIEDGVSSHDFVNDFRNNPKNILITINAGE